MKGDKLCPFCQGTGKKNEFDEIEHLYNLEGGTSGSLGYITRIKKGKHGVKCDYRRKTRKDFRRIVLEE